MTVHSPYGTKDDPFGADIYTKDQKRNFLTPVEAGQSNPVPYMRKAWQQGTLMKDGGKSMFRLSSPVGDRFRNSEADTAKVQSILERAGFMDLKDTDGPTGYYSFLTDEPTRAAQKANGLKIDGEVHPNGETIRTLKAKIGPKPNAVSVSLAKSPQIAQAAPASNPPAPRPKPPQVKIVNPTGRGLRNDGIGLGHFGASRRTGTRKRFHEGIDLEVKPGDPVLSPIDGSVVHRGKAYANDSRFDSIWIDGTGRYKGLRVKILYVGRFNPGGARSPSGNVVGGRTVLGAAQDLRTKFGAKMKPHVHMEAYWNGKRIDPASILPKLP